MNKILDSSKNGKILNLTQHKATPDQIKDGVVDLGDE